MKIEQNKDTCLFHTLPSRLPCSLALHFHCESFWTNPNTQTHAPTHTHIIHTHTLTTHNFSLMNERYATRHLSSFLSLYEETISPKFGLIQFTMFSISLLLLWEKLRQSLSRIDDALVKRAQFSHPLYYNKAIMLLLSILNRYRRKQDAVRQIYKLNFVRYARLQAWMQII